MKVFHGPLNIAGIPGVLAKAERALGIDSKSVCYPTNVYRYYSDITISPDSAYSLKFIIGTALKYDLFCFHFGHSLTGDKLWDVPWLKRMGKKVCFFFHGCDLRSSKYVVSKYEVNPCRNHWPMGCSANRMKAQRIARKFADAVFVSTPDLLEFIEGSVWVPQPLDLDWLNRFREISLNHIYDENKKDVLIAHAPSDRSAKGTVYLEKAVNDLKNSGVNIELRLVENKPYEEALAFCAEADIVVDQLLAGAYGQYAVEMMALGKPVVSYIREDVRSKYPDDMPVISADPNVIQSVLLDLINRKSEWKRIGASGIEYVNRVHDSKKVALITTKYYK